MNRLDGDRTPEMRQSRERLSVSRDCVELALGSLPIDPDQVPETRRFGNRLAAEAERWSQRIPPAERGRIGKADAARMFAAAFGSAPRKSNSLGSYRRGGRP
jgi:hypothetical protein